MEKIFSQVFSLCLWQIDYGWFFFWKYHLMSSSRCSRNITCTKKIRSAKYFSKAVDQRHQNPIRNACKFVSSVGPASYPGVSNESKKRRKKRPLVSSRNGTWEGLALAQRTCAKKLMLDPKSARTRLGMRQVWDHQRKNSESPSRAEPDQRSNAVPG